MGKHSLYRVDMAVKFQRVTIETSTLRYMYRYPCYVLDWGKLCLYLMTTQGISNVQDYIYILPVSQCHIYLSEGGNATHIGLWLLLFLSVTNLCQYCLKVTDWMLGLKKFSYAFHFGGFNVEHKPVLAVWSVLSTQCRGTCPR